MSAVYILISIFSRNPHIMRVLEKDTKSRTLINLVVKLCGSLLMLFAVLEFIINIIIIVIY